jgi:hypothetical protein
LAPLALHRDIKSGKTNAKPQNVSGKFMTDIFRQINRSTKTVLIIGLTLVLYGYLCRLIDFSFFWESKTIGWTIVFVGLILSFKDLHRKPTVPKRNKIIQKISIGLIAFILIVQTIFICVIPFTDAYAVAKDHLTSDADLNNDIGTIKGFGLIPVEQIQKTMGAAGEYGNATINLIVKGDKKNKDVTISLSLYSDQKEW